MLYTPTISISRTVCTLSSGCYTSQPFAWWPQCSWDRSGSTSNSTQPQLQFSRPGSRCFSTASG